MLPLYLLGRPKLAYTLASAAVTMDGNSLVAGQGASSGSITTRLAALAPLAGPGIAVTNLGVGGQTWRNMNGLSEPSGGNPSTDTTDVDGAFVGGKTNVLLAWEGTNSLFFNGSVSQTLTDAANYIAARKAAHAWRVVLLTCIPRLSAITSTGGDTDAALNAKLIQYNAALRANFRAMGADALCDVAAPGSRHGAVFDGGVYTTTTFDAVGPGWYSTADGAGVRVHQTDAGYDYLAGLVAAALRRLPK